MTTTTTALKRLHTTLKRLSEQDYDLDIECNAFSCYISKGDCKKASTAIEKVFPKETWAFHSITIEKAKHTALVTLPLFA